ALPGAKESRAQPAPAPTPAPTSPESPPPPRAIALPRPPEGSAREIGARLWRGQLELSHESYEAAAREYGDALALDPGNALALLGRGRARRRLGETAAAYADLLAAHRLAPALAEPLFELAETALLLGLRDKARRFYAEY